MAHKPYSTKIITYLTSFFSVELLLLAGSFISFPVFARLLTKKDYGLMSLIMTTLTLVTLIGSANLPEAVWRFHGKYIKCKQSYQGTIRLSTIMMGLISTCLFVMLSWVMYKIGIIEIKVFYLLLFVAPLIIIRMMSRLEIAFMRVQEKVLAVNIVNIANRYGVLFGSIIFVILYKNIFGYYAGVLLAEFVVLVGIYFLFKETRRCSSYDFTIFKESVKYSFPLAFTFIFSSFLASGDRYVIAYFLDSAKVADYSVSYNFCTYPVDIIRNTIMFSFVPIIMNAWNQGTLEKSNPYISNFISIYFWLIMPIIFGLSSVRIEGMQLLAGDKYSGSGYLIPVIIIGIAINGMAFIFNSGFMYKGKTRMMLYIAVSLALLNFVMNILLVPFIGLMGAAISTLITYVFYMLTSGYYSYYVLKFRLPLRDMFFSVVSGAGMGIMLIVIDKFIFSTHLLSKVIIGGVIYILFMSFFARSQLKALRKIYLR